MQSGRANFGSKLGVILATAGSAVGLGNVWRFPYMAGDHGGAAFILIYICCVFLLGIPCMVSEFVIGRHAASNTARAYGSLSGGKPWALVGYLGVLTGFLITGYYAVVSGWCLQYVFASLMGHLHGSPEFSQTIFRHSRKILSSRCFGRLPLCFLPIISLCTVCAAALRRHPRCLCPRFLCCCLSLWCLRACFQVRARVFRFV